MASSKSKNPRSRIGNPVLPAVATLLIGLSLVGCQNVRPTSLSGNPPPRPNNVSPNATITPTALPVLTEKIKNNAPLNLNDQVALHMMKLEDRRKLMEEMRKAKR